MAKDNNNIKCNGYDNIVKNCNDFLIVSHIKNIEYTLLIKLEKLISINKIIFIFNILSQFNHKFLVSKYFDKLMPEYIKYALQY